MKCTSQRKSIPELEDLFFFSILSPHRAIQHYSPLPQVTRGIRCGLLFRVRKIPFLVELKMAETPSVKDLPKIADSLKGELMQEHALKHTEANEKIVLPSAEDLKMEKTHQNILSGKGKYNLRYVPRGPLEKMKIQSFLAYRGTVNENI